MNLILQASKLTLVLNINGRLFFGGIFFHLKQLIHMPADETAYLDAADGDC